MKIIIAGATGFIGRALTETLLKEGHDLTLVARHAPKETSISNVKLHSMIWNPDDETGILREINGADAVINLAGEPIVGKRWTDAQKMKLLESRVHATKFIARSIDKASIRPKVLINASAIGYYGSRGNEELAEEARGGEGFVSEMCRAWEAHAIRVEDFGVRVVRLRIGIVLGKGGGALAQMLPPFQMYLGGWLGSGNQWMSWIHRDDLARLIVFCLENKTAQGAVNAVSPQAVTNKAFSMVLAQVLNRPCLLPMPELVLKLLLGEMSFILLASQRVIPKRAKELCFSFQYSEIRKALDVILH